MAPSGALCACWFDAELRHLLDCFGSRRDTELGVNRGDVRLDRRTGQIERLGDLPERTMRREEGGDSELGGREVKIGRVSDSLVELGEPGR
jgi:hypothetical protein